MYAGVFFVCVCGGGGGGGGMGGEREREREREGCTSVSYNMKLPYECKKNKS